MRRNLTGPLIATFLALVSHTVAGDNLVPNGNFEAFDAKGEFPVAWVVQQKEKVELAKDGNNHWVRFKNGGRLRCMVDVKPAWKWIRVAARMKATNVKPGAESWSRPRINLTWTTKSKPIYQGLDQTEDMDWGLREAAFQVPKDSMKLQVEPGVFECQGTFEVDDISITSVTAEEARKINERKSPQKQPAAVKKATPEQPKSGNGMAESGRIENGTFELLDRDGRPKGWHGAGKVVAEGGNHYIEISRDKAGWHSLDSRLGLLPEWSSLTLSARMKVKDLKKGKEGWQTSRVSFAFEDKNGKKVGNYPPSLELKADTDWTRVSKTFPIPAGAVFLKIQAGLHHATGTFAFDDIKVEPVLGAGMSHADPSAVTAGARRAASEMPALKLQEVGVEINPEMARQLQLRRVRPVGTPLTVLSIGPGCPGLADAPKARVVKYPPHWKIVETPKVLGGHEAAPDVLLMKLPDVLLDRKPEIVLVWGDVTASRKMKPSERTDWEDVITICLRMGSLPILVLPNGDVKFSGGGGDVGMIAEPKKKEEPKEEDLNQNADLEALRRTMISVGGSGRIPMVEQAPFATTSERLDKILTLVEKHILGRTPPKRATEPGTGTKKPGTEIEEE